jgi:hypothetical protein
MQDNLGAIGDVISTAWTLNKMGLRMFLQVLAASTKKNKRTSATRYLTLNEPGTSSLSECSLEVVAFPKA